jgi:uncharacterized phage protein (TIGR01671 family)
MNNTLKIRVWDKTKNQYLNDSFFCIYKNHAYKLEIGSTQYLSNGSSYNPVQFSEDEHGLPYYDRQLIIQQYTGMNDLDGKEIYEGDLIELHNVYNGSLNDNDYGLYEVVFDRCYKLKTIKNNWFLPKSKYHDIHEFNIMLVVGNIFQTPELIKK